MDNTSATASITQKATQSVKWSALMEAVSRTAAPIIMVILARLLTPEDFGVVATAMIAISFAQMFWDAGLSKALIQTNEAPEEAAHVVFWTNLALGIIIYALLFIAAPWVAIFFNSLASGPVLRVLGLQIVIASLSSVQQALFVRDLNFRKLFWIKLSTAFLPGFFSIPLAIYDYGVWALVAGTLAGQTLNLILLWSHSHWRPKFRYDSHLARSMLGFGVWVLAESFGGWLLMWGDNLIVGRLLGAHDLGLYRTGWMLVSVIFGFLLYPFLPVLYPTFSRLQDDLPGLKMYFHKVNRVIMSLALPMGIGLLLLGPELATVLFGDKWQGLGFVLSILGLTLGLAWPVGINADIYRAISKPDVNAKLMVVTILIYMPVYYIAAQFGLSVFLYVRLSLVFVGLAIHSYIYYKIIEGPFFYLWHDGKNFILAAITMGACIWILKWGVYPIFPALPQFLVLGFLIVMGMAIYAATLWLLDSDFIVQTFKLIRRAATR
jgi:PST family polysaccharide transporter